MKTLKSIGAVFAGMVTIVILSIATDSVLEAIGIFPPPEQGIFITWMLIVALLYRSIYAIAGGYITALLAPDRPVRHSVILGIIGTVVSIVGVFVGWNLSAHWYPIALVVTSLPCTWLGGNVENKIISSQEK